MKDFLRRIKADFLLSSVLCILLGVVFVIWNNSVINVMGSVLAIGMIVIGAVYLCSFFLNIVTMGLSVVMNSGIGCGHLVSCGASGYHESDPDRDRCGTFVPRNPGHQGGS